jgi:hypothetical protein
MPRPGFDSRHGRLNEVLSGCLRVTNHSSSMSGTSSHAHYCIHIRSHTIESDGYSV